MVQVQQQVHHGPRGVELESSRAGSRQMLGLGDSGGAAAAVAEQAHLIAFSASSSWEASAGSCCFSAAAAGPCWAACSCCSSSIAAGTREGSFATCGANTGSQISYWHSWSSPRTCSGARGVTTLPARAFLGPEAAIKTYHTVLQVLRNATRPPGCCRAAPPARQRVHASPTGLLYRAHCRDHFAHATRKPALQSAACPAFLLGHPAQGPLRQCHAGLITYCDASVRAPKPSSRAAPPQRRRRQRCLRIRFNSAGHGAADQPGLPSQAAAAA